MDERRLAEIEARAHAATPPPWRLGSPLFRCMKDHGDRKMHPGGAACSYTFSGWYDTPSEISRDREYAAGDPASAANDALIAGTFDYDSGGIVRPEDAAFIAHAREDVPALVAEIRRLRTELRGRG